MNDISSMAFLEPYLIQAIRFYLMKISASILKDQKIQKGNESPRNKIFNELNTKMIQANYQLVK